MIFTLCFVFCPMPVKFCTGLLACVSILHLKHGDIFIELHIRLVDFVKVVFGHQTPPTRGLASNQFPLFFKYRFIHHSATLLRVALLQGLSFIGSYRDFVYNKPPISPSRHNKIVQLIRHSAA